ncbi:MAG: hypothetical protein ABLT11_05370 [Candidatus Acidiferrum sp.]
MAMRTVMIRRFIFVVAAVIWVAAPVLACVPKAAMTDAEMACCQKMGGECDMGVGNHACCKDSMHRAPGAAVVAQNLQTDVPLAAIAAVADVYDEIFAEYVGGDFLVHVGLPGLPLELNSILRI